MLAFFKHDILFPAGVTVFQIGEARKRPGEAEKFPSSERFIYALWRRRRTSIPYVAHSSSTSRATLCTAQTPPDAGYSFLGRRGNAGAFCRQCRLLMLPPAPQQSNEIVNVICVLEFQDCGCCIGHIVLKPGILQGILQE